MFQSINADPILRIAEKRVTEWAAAFVVACYDQVQAMTSVQFSYLDKMGELQTGR